MNPIEITLGQLIHRLVEDYQARYADQSLAMIATEALLNEYFFEAVTSAQTETEGHPQA